MATIKELKQEAKESAIDNLARYKFMMFGYWAAIWIYLNQVDVAKEPNPFRELVAKAREIQHIGGKHELHNLDKGRIR